MRNHERRDNFTGSSAPGNLFKNLRLGAQSPSGCDLQRQRGSRVSRRYLGHVQLDGLVILVQFKCRLCLPAQARRCQPQAVNKTLFCKLTHNLKPFNRFSRFFFEQCFPNHKGRPRGPVESLLHRTIQQIKPCIYRFTCFAQMERNGTTEIVHKLAGQSIGDGGRIKLRLRCFRRVIFLGSPVPFPSIFPLRQGCNIFKDNFARRTISL